MKIRMTIGGAMATAVLLTGCHTTEDVAEKVVEATVEKPAVPEETCPVLESANWIAFVNKMPGPDASATITVAGDVTMRTPGYTFEWVEGPLDRSAMPTLRLKLKATPPEGMVMQVLTTETISYKAPALSTGYSKVLVGCGDDVLAEITDIEEVS